MDFGERIRTLREEKGMSQQKLAEMLYVTRQTVSRWECGTRYPDLITAKSLADILDATLDSLMADESRIKLEQRARLYYRRAGKIETMLYAICIAISIVTAVISIIRAVTALDTYSFDTNYICLNLILIVDVVFYLFITIMLVLGMIKTIREDIPLRSAGFMGIVFFTYRGVITILLSPVPLEVFFSDYPFNKILRPEVAPGILIVFCVSCLISAFLYIYIVYTIWRFFVYKREVNQFAYVVTSVSLVFINMINIVWFGLSYSRRFEILYMMISAIPLIALFSVFYGVIMRIGFPNKGV